MIIPMRRCFVVSAALFVSLFSTGLASAGGAGTTPNVSLRIAFTSRPLTTLHYTLACEPTSGTMARADAACAAIAVDPNMVLGEPERPSESPRPLKAISCPAPSEIVEITGTFHGTPVHTTSTDTCSAAPIVPLWTPFLPSRRYLRETRVDSGVEALQIGQTRASVRALLGPPTAHHRSADVYQTGAVLQVHLGVPVVLVVSYDAHHRVATLISNDLPAINGRWDVTRNPHPPSPLVDWRTARCAGRRSLADHPLAGHRVTTIVWPSADHPTVIVTSEPSAACRLARATEQAPLPLG
jgi:hypothetical protein